MLHHDFQGNEEALVHTTLLLGDNQEYQTRGEEYQIPIYLKCGVVFLNLFF